MSDYYLASGSPASHSFGFSAQVRAEFSNIATAFAKLPAITGAPSYFVRVNASATALESIDAATALTALGGVSAVSAGSTYVAKAGDTMTGTLVLNTGTNQPIRLITSSGGSFAISLERSDLGVSSRVYNPGNYWSFEHRPLFAGNTPWDSANLSSPLTTSAAASTYQPISGMSSYLTTSAAASTYAALASPTLTGTPAAPTATAGTNTTQLATTAFVAAAVATGGGSYLPLSGGTLTGALAITTSATGQLLNLNSTTANGGYLAWMLSGTAKGYAGSSAQLSGGSASDITLRSEGAIQFATNGGTARVWIDTGGKVGIGSAPTSFLDVNTGSTANPTLTVQASSITSNKTQLGLDTSVGRSFLASSSSYPLAFDVNGSERMRIDANGWTAIGGSVVGSRRLTIEAAGGIYGRWNATAASTAYWEIFAAAAAIGYFGSSDGAIGIAGGVGLRSETFLSLSSGGPTERMRIDSSGRLLVGTTDTTGLLNAGGLISAKFAGMTASASGAGLRISDTGTSSNRIMMSVNSSGAYLYSGGSVSNPDLIVSTNDGGTELGRFTSGGPNFQVGPGGGASSVMRAQVWSNYYGDFGSDTSYATYINGVNNGAAGAVQIRRNGTVTATFDASGNTTLSGALIASGSTKIGTGVAGNTSRLLVNMPSGNAVGIQLFQDSVESWIVGMAASSGVLKFSNSGTDRMTLDGSGNLTVSAAGTFAGVLKANGGSKGYGNITTQTLTTTPTGGSSGDFVFMY